MTIRGFTRDDRTSLVLTLKNDSIFWSNFLNFGLIPDIIVVITYIIFVLYLQNKRKYMFDISF